MCYGDCARKYGNHTKYASYSAGRRVEKNYLTERKSVLAGVRSDIFGLQKLQLGIVFLSPILRQIWFCCVRLPDVYAAILMWGRQARRAAGQSALFCQRVNCIQVDLGHKFQVFQIDVLVGHVNRLFRPGKFRSECNAVGQATAVRSAADGNGFGV